MSGDPRIHSSLTAQRVAEASRKCLFGTVNTGFCTKCGKSQEGCEPDAWEYKCNNCGNNTVYSAVIMMTTFLLH